MQCYVWIIENILYFYRTYEEKITKKSLTSFRQTEFSFGFINIYTRVNAQNKCQAYFICEY